VADLTYTVDSSCHATIMIRGDIEAGDAERFEQLAARVCQDHLDPELPSITAALDSHGGNYLEGLALGNTFHRLGYGTRVNAAAECYSAAAFAFLGGAYLGRVGGWGPDRTVELGGRVVFLSFYSSASEPVGLGEGIEHGKRLAMILADYATAFRIDMGFIIESLEHGPGELLVLQTVQHFRDLKVKVQGLTPVIDLNVERAVLAANYATNWRRPISLQPKAGESLAIVREINADEYHRNILEHLVAPNYCHGPLTDIIRATISSGDAIQIRALFEDSRRLNTVPSTWAADGSRVFHVRGFQYGATFYVSDCYVVASGEATPNLGIEVVTVHFQNHLEKTHFSKSGDILFEVHPPATVLWSTDLTRA
jgi:hypothetical protein